MEFQLQKNIQQDRERIAVGMKINRADNGDVLCSDESRLVAEWMVSNFGSSIEEIESRDLLSMYCQSVCIDFDIKDGSLGPRWFEAYIDRKNSKSISREIASLLQRIAQQQR